MRQKYREVKVINHVTGCVNTFYEVAPLSTAIEAHLIDTGNSDAVAGLRIDYVRWDACYDLIQYGGPGLLYIGNLEIRYRNDHD